MTGAAALAIDPPDQDRIPVVVAGLIAGLTLGLALGLMPLGAVLIGLAAVICAALAIARPTWAIVLLMLSLPLEFTQLTLGPFTGISPLQIGLMLILAIALVSSFTHERPWVPRTPLDVPILLWIAVVTFGTIETLDTSVVLKKIGMLFLMTVGYYITVSSVRTPERAKLVMGSVVAGCCAVGVYGLYVIYQFLNSGTVTKGAVVVGSEGMKVPRASAAMTDPNALANLLAMAIPIAIALFVLSKKWPAKVAALGSIAILFASLGYTFSRGAWIGSFLSLMVLATDRRFWRILIVIAIVLALVSPGAIAQRAATSTQTGRGEITARFDFWEAALQFIEQRPLFGIGTGNFAAYFPRASIPETAAREAIHAHNIILILLVENGVIGFFVHILLLGTMLVVALKNRRASPDAVAAIGRLAVVAGVVAHYGQQATDGLHLSPPLNTVLWILFGIGIALAGSGYSADGPHGEEIPAVTGSADVSPA